MITSMGSYAECWLGSIYVGSTKNDIDDSILQLFRATDKRHSRCATKDWPHPGRRWVSQSEPDEEVDVVYYSAPAWVVKERLELKGYTLPTAKAALMESVRAEVKGYSERRTDHPELEKYYASQLRVLGSLDIDKWMDALRAIKRRGPQSWETKRPFGEPDENLEDYMLRTDWYGYSGVDFYVPLRLALEVCDAEDNLVYDLTELVNGGYFRSNDDFVKFATEFFAVEHRSNSKTIILTEGSSDSWIISDSLKLLYAHLADYFTFMDFELTKMEGGSAHLARIVKAFAGAGIVNKILAVFDNDTAGKEAIQSLGTQLPANLRAVQLPPLDALRSYPTEGPTGCVAMDVNGLAGSIELYLGADVLCENGKPIPVQWKSYSATLGQYHGEVRDKAGIQRRFKSKLRAFEKGTSTENADWSGVRAILAAIFSAFHAFDAEIILDERRGREWL